MSFIEKERLQAIEVSVGTNLARKYLLGYDYSIDRDPNYTWGGGATGDLTLKTVALYGTDGTSALPSLTFSYNNARLASASNGIGGTVSFTYERAVTTIALYSAARLNWSWTSCDPYATTNSTPDPYCGAPTLLGYIYPYKIDRYRVTSRTVADGRGWSATTQHSYSGFQMGPDGKEFRGHSAVRTVDPAGHYTDIWFKQDDVLKGRPYQTETRRNDGALHPLAGRSIRFGVLGPALGSPMKKAVKGQRSPALAATVLFESPRIRTQSPLGSGVRGQALTS